MKPQFQHQIITSFALWLPYVLLQRGEAFQNIESSFYHQSDPRLDSNFVSFASPHKQWVTDSSISKANIINGITLNDRFIGRNDEDIKYDFDNGRVLIPSTLANAMSSVEGSYAVKDFNIYITDQTEEELLIESKFDTNSRFDQGVFEGIQPYDQVVPAIFISYESGGNEPFAFGGEDATKSFVRCVIFAENSFQLDGVFSILADLNFVSVANVGFNEHPLNEFGDLKLGHYDYKDLSERYFNLQNSHSIFHIENCTVSKLNDRVAKQTHPGLYIGFADFNLISHRFPRQELFEPIPSRPPAIRGVPLAPVQLKLGPQLAIAPHSLSLKPQLGSPPTDLSLIK